MKPKEGSEEKTLEQELRETQAVEKHPLSEEQSTERNKQQIWQVSRNILVASSTTY